MKGTTALAYGILIVTGVVALVSMITSLYLAEGVSGLLAGAACFIGLMILVWCIFKVAEDLAG